MRRLAGHTAGIRGIAQSESGRDVAACCRDGRVLIWNSSTGDLIQTISTGFPAPTLVDFVGDSQILVAGPMSRGNLVPGGPGRNHPVYSGCMAGLWDRASGRFISQYLSPGGVPPAAVAFDRRRGRILSVSHRLDLDRWDIATGQHLGKVDGPLEVAKFPYAWAACGFDGDTGRCAAIAVDPHDPSASALYFIDLLEPSHRRIDPGSSPGPQPLLVAISGDGRVAAVWIANLSGDHEVVTLDYSSGKLLGKIPTPSGTFASFLSLSGDGGMIALGGQDGRLLALVRQSGRVIGDAKADGGIVRDILPVGPRWQVVTGWGLQPTEVRDARTGQMGIEPLGVSRLEATVRPDAGP